MPDPQGRPPVNAVDQSLATWRAAFDDVARQAHDSHTLFDEALSDADSEDAHAGALVALARVRARGEHAIAAIANLTHRVEQLHAEWRAARRYDPDVVQGLAEELAARVAADAVSGAREWLAEILEAVDAGEWDAAETLAGSELGWPAELAAGARELRDGARQWRRGDHTAGLELMERLGDGDLDGWRRVLSLELRSRAYRLAAWVSLRHLKDAGLAEEHLGTAITLWPHAGRMHAERAAYYLSTGDLDMAATDAQRSVELATDDAAGYLELGIWAELSGDFDDADEFYRRALTLLPTFEVARLGRRVALMDPPGRLLTRAAEVLLDARRPRDALLIAEQALHADQRGPELHPQAATHDVRALALEQLKDREPAEAAAAALEAGRLHAWNGNVHWAIERFERALALDDGLREVGWLLADARLTTSLPVGATLTDQPTVQRALETWEGWAAKVGPPQGATSWAYLTRAMIADLGTQRPEADRLAGIWDALLYVEKALLHDRVDPQRWGYAAQYLRFLHLDELAFEAADRGYELGSAERQVLAERLAQLAHRGPLDEADRLARELVTMFGNDPWVSAARAWLAIHSDRATRYVRGLELLELPIAGGNDPSWYYEMRALCHVGRRDLDAARADFREMLVRALPVDGPTKCRLELAAVALGDATQAARWSAEAARDPTSRPITRLTADAFAAFARGELDAATELLTRAATHATSVVELHDVCDLTLLRLPLLDGDDDTLLARERAVAAVAAGPVKEREQALRRTPPSADQELADALAASAAEDAPHPVARVALLAVKARRDAQAGRLSEAAASYQELISSSFEPEAALGLTRALRGLARQQASAGHVDRVRELTARMSALGNVSGADVATTVASALESSGRRSAARERLETAITTSTDDRERAKLHQRAGELALADDDLDDASTHFQAALDIAGDADHGRRGQVQIRMALIAVLRDDPAAAREHLIATARAWKDGGAIDPTAALIGELDGLTRLRHGGWEVAAREALELVERAVASGGAKAELEPLRRELGFE
jgi:tetratricopeptide (TPR) repeat protein